MAEKHRWSAEICRKECENTYYIQTVDDLNAEKSAKYIHQDTMKKIGTSKDFSQILAMSTCSSDYTDARTVILAVMKPYSPEK